MNIPFLDELLRLRRGFVVTVVGVEGHSYKPAGHRALYAIDGIRPIHGNLGSLCVDQELLRQGRLACEEGRPRLLDIDTSKPVDIHAGHGAFCGGRMQLLVEPLLEQHAPVYEALRAALRGGERCALVHDLASGEISLRSHRPAAAEGRVVESFRSMPRLYVFGATPLAEQLLLVTAELPLRFRLVDWRPAHLEAMHCAEHVERELDLGALDHADLLLVISHDFERDRQALVRGLVAECRWIGLLSSPTRRDRMFHELRESGFSEESIAHVASPVGLPIGGRSDAEIAVSIAAQLIGELH